MEAADSLIGDVLAERYRIESLLGTGGMGAVYRARDVRDDSAVALKIVLPGEQRPALLPRFLREARLASRIHHSHVVRVLDFGRWGSPRDRYYLSMELVDGIPLGQLLDAGLDAGACATLMSQVLEALTHVHARGVLHRDVKPDNILVCRQANGDLSVKVTDFGIAAAFGDDDATRLTQEGAALGTPAYMAPEQAEGHTIAGPRLDLYPVGVILYRLIAGVLPFEGTVARILLAKISEDPVPPRPRPGVELSSGLGDVVMRLLARQPADRFAMAPDASAALQPYCTPARIAGVRWLELGGAAPTLFSEPGGDQTVGAADATQVAVTPRWADADALWGREQERAELDAVVREVEDGAPRVVLITGQAGIGKTALMRDLAIRLYESGRFEVVHAVHEPATGARGGLRSALDQVLGTVGRSIREVELAAKQFLGRLGMEDEGEVRCLVELLRPGAGDAERTGTEQQGRNFALLHRILRALARERPIMLAIDDLLAGGADAAAFLSYLLFEAALDPFPLLVVVTFRDRRQDPQFSQVLGRTDRHEGQERRTIELGGLERDALVRGLMDTEGLTEGAAGRVVERAGGNPLFAIHLARGWGGAEAPTGAERTGASSAEVTLPQSLQAMIESSLRDRLRASSDAERLHSRLVWLAILGQYAHVELLARCVGDDERAHLDDDLDDLLDLAILAQSEQQSADIVGFPHGVMRDALLATLNPRRLRRYHGRAADARIEWSEAQGRAEAEAGAIGDHCDAAQRGEEAIGWWLKAVAHEIRAGDAMLGVRWGMTALERMEPADSRRHPLATRLGRLMFESGDLDAAIELLKPVIESGSPDDVLVAAEVLGDVYENRGDGAAWDALIAAVEPTAEGASDTGLRAHHTTVALWLTYHSRWSEAIVHARQAFDLAEPGPGKGRAGLRLAYLRGMLGDPAAGAELAETVVAHVEHRSDLLIRALRVLGVLHRWCRRISDAIAAHTRALELARRTGRTARIPIAFVDLGQCYLEAGDGERARQLFEDSRRSASELGLDGVVVMSDVWLIRFDMVAGASDGLVGRVLDLRERAVRAGMHHLARLAVGYLGWAYLLEGSYDDARTVLEKLAEVDRPKMFEVAITVGDIGHALWQVHADGREDFGDLARAYLEEAATLWSELGHGDRAARCRDLVERLPNR